MTKMLFSQQSAEDAFRSETAPSKSTADVLGSNREQVMQLLCMQHYTTGTLHHATRRHSLQKLPIALQDTPDQICGVAHRVGYTGAHPDDLAMYRLKVRIQSNIPAMTLPQFFVLECGLFVDYEEWRCAQSHR